MEEFVFEKRDGKLRLIGHCVQDYAAWVNKLENGTHYRAAFKQLSPSKSQEQLGYYFAVVVPDVIKGLRENGQNQVGFTWIAGTHVPLALTTDNVDRFLKVLYASAHGIEEPVSKAAMSKKEMSKFIEFILGWAHQNSIAIRPAENGTTC